MRTSRVHLDGKIVVAVVVLRQVFVVVEVACVAGGSMCAREIPTRLLPIVLRAAGVPTPAGYAG